MSSSQREPSTRVFCATAYPDRTPGPRVRIAGFAPHLRPYGVQLDYRPTLTNAEYEVLSSSASPGRKAALLTRAAARAAVRKPPRHDLLLIHRLRCLTPVPGLDPPNRLDVYDFDDALYLGSTSDTNRSFHWAKQEARRCRAYLQRARLVIAGNSFLAEQARKHARRVEVVPSCVDPSRQQVHEHGEAETVTVGWIGSPTTSVYLKPVLPVFDRLNAGRLRARLVVVGATTPTRARWIEHRSWSLESECRDLASFDIGIMPLPDTDWARGKCGFKALQYFAAGIPVVASPVGVATGLVGDDRGLIASSTEDWRAALEGLIRDPLERRQRGANARKFVESQYSYQTWAPHLATMLRSVTR